MLHLNFFVVPNKEHEGGNQTLSKQIKYYRKKCKHYFMSDCGN